MLKQAAVATLISVSALFAHAGNPDSVTLDVKGMDCAACPITIKAVLKKQPGVSDAKVDFKKAMAEVTFDPAKVTPQRLAEVVTQAGFPSSVRK